MIKTFKIRSLELTPEEELEFDILFGTDINNICSKPIGKKGVDWLKLVISRAKCENRTFINSIVHLDKKGEIKDVKYIN